jgi:trimeric autotransporter adhesin
MKKRVLRLIITISVIININPVYAQIISTIAGGATGHGGYWGDGGPATAAQLGIFGGLAVDHSGNIYIADGNNQRVRKVDAATGIITTIAGIGIAGYNGDGILATSAKLNGPGIVSVDNSGNVYIGDGLNYRIRKVDVVTGIISTFAGNGINGYGGDGVPATSTAIKGGAFTFDRFGNFYMEDGANYRVRKINLAGIITTIAGTGTEGSTGDGGPATAARINEQAIGICTDTSGNIYLPDSSMSIRKIDITTGIINRVAGSGDFIGIPYSGDGLLATTSHIDPNGVTIDAAGNMFIADYGNNRIEKVNTLGIIYSIAGTGINGFSGDGGPATAAKLNYPENVVVDGCGNIYIADFNNARVRKISYPPILTTPTISLSGASSYPAGSTVTVTASVGSAGASYLIHWFNHGIEFTTTTVPSVTYTKPPGTDTITARIVPTGWGCWDSTTSSQHIVSTDVTGVSSVNEPWCMVYPNPVQTTLMAVTLWKEGALTIYNTVGQTVLAKQFYKRGIRVNVGNLPAGIYMLKITGAESETVITRFIKQCLVLK